MLGSALFGTWNQQLRVGYIYNLDLATVLKELQNTGNDVASHFSSLFLMEEQLRCNGDVS